MRTTRYLWAAPFYQAKAGTGINQIVRFHYSNGTWDQFGLLESVAVAPAGSAVFARPDYVDKPENTEYEPPDNPSNAFAGEQLMVAPPPPGATIGDPFRGRADFWQFRFSHFIVGMNPSQTPQTMVMPAGFTSGRDLIGGNLISGPSAAIAPSSRIALYLAASAHSDGSFDACPLPGTPLAVTYSATNTAVNLSWSDPPSAVGYDVLRRLQSEANFSSVATDVKGTSYTDSLTLDANNPPSYSIAATNTCGCGHASGAVGPVYSMQSPANSSSGDVGLFSISRAGSDIGVLNGVPPADGRMCETRASLNERRGSALHDRERRTL